MKKPFLHELKELGELYAVLAGEIGTKPQVVEKDYWLMHCLWGLKEQGFVFELKGGTSLSKGYNVIHRFSEDIDIYIHPPEGMDVKCGKNHDKASHVESRRAYFDWLTAEIKIPGIISVERDKSFDDEKMRNAGIRLIYGSRYELLPDLKPSILLEAGFDLTTPNEPLTITSWAYDRAAKASLDIRDNRAQGIPCYLPEYTFVEKLQTISTKYRKQQEEGTMPVNFIRHYYDAYQLLALERVQKFIGTEKYIHHKERRFGTLDEKNLMKNEAFILTDAATRKLYISEYQRTSAIYYKAQPSFDQIMAKIGQYLSLM
jgi:predicted nucleotidyltransferase component of viral defense system